MPNYDSDLPANYYFGGGGETFAPSLAIAVLVLAIILILTLPRKYAFVPFLLAGLLIPQKVGLVVATLHFDSARLLLLAGWTRLLSRRECYPNSLNSLDKAVLYGGLVNSVAFILVWREFGAVVNRMGFLFSALGTYFLLRSMIQDKEDVIRVIKALLLVVIVVAPLMLREHLTQFNTFSWLGAPELSDLRNGQVRAQGPFAHAIIAGTFGAVSIPLFVGLWWYKPRTKLLVTIGVVSSTVMMVASSSSTPVVAFPAGIIALAIWPFRKEMRMVRWGLIAILIGMQLVMKVPIWFLLDRISGILGGSGWHRAMLIDNFVYHFFEWCLIGTRNNSNWGWSMWDVDNAYVGAGLMGGLPGFILFLAVFVYGYKMIGRARRETEKSPVNERLIWAIGAAFFANTVAFFGIVYFDQSMIAWLALLVMISVITIPAVVEGRAQPGSAMAFKLGSAAVVKPLLASNLPPKSIF